MKKDSINFAVWLAENCWDLVWQDVDKDGRVWSKFNEYELGFKREDTGRFTIEELYTKFKRNGI